VILAVADTNSLLRPSSRAELEQAEGAEKGLSCPSPCPPIDRRGTSERLVRCPPAGPPRSVIQVRAAGIDHGDDADAVDSDAGPDFRVVVPFAIERHHDHGARRRPSRRGSSSRNTLRKAQPDDAVREVVLGVAQPRRLRPMTPIARR
jgi:hypothetical protein